ncbi:MAG: hypothetical protein ACE5H1_06680, partial [Thermodesulfobacteriota bacterium]
MPPVWLNDPLMIKVGFLKKDLLVRWATWIATGVGVGYFPVFPGTIGSLVGLFLFLFLQHLSPA